jgi:outer membrane protein X
MKKSIKLCALLALLFFASNVYSQNKIGVFLGYGTGVEQAGLGVNAELPINSKVAISPSFVYWFPQDPVSWWEINGNVNYYFQDKFYGIAGLNFFHASVENFGGNTEVGVNLGVGYNFDSGGSVVPFGEAKFVLSDAVQLALFFGIRFKL